MGNIFPHPINYYYLVQQQVPFDKRFQIATRPGDVALEHILRQSASELELPNLLKPEGQVVGLEGLLPSSQPVTNTVTDSNAILIAKLQVSAFNFLFIFKIVLHLLLV